MTPRIVVIPPHMLKFLKKKKDAGTAKHDPAEPDGDEAGRDPAGSAPARAEDAAADAPTRSWRERLSGSGIARGLGGLFRRHVQLDDALLDELETILLTSDVGVAASTTLVEDLRQRMRKREFADAAALRQALYQDPLAILEPVAAPLDLDTHKPFVLLVVGVNGVGKTTTIGKLAKRLQNEGRSVMLAAGDTFRAAAVEQLQVWGERNAIPVVAQHTGADSASVIYDALQAAQSRGTDVLIADTAGRLHTQSNLMEELKKVKRVLAKLDPDAPHEVLLVVDAGTGQNALSQAQQFHAAVGVTGIALTKLDGTAKGGIIFAIGQRLGLPIRFIGVGEGIDDLRTFEAGEFVDALFEK